MATIRATAPLLLIVILAGLQFASVSNIQNTLYTYIDPLKQLSIVITLTCLLLGCILFAACNFSMGDQIRKAFVMAMQAMFAMAIIGVIIYVVVPPVIQIIYGPPPCAGGTMISCGTSGLSCCSTTQTCGVSISDGSPKCCAGNGLFC